MTHALRLRMSKKDPYLQVGNNSFLNYSMYINNIIFILYILSWRLHFNDKGTWTGDTPFDISFTRYLIFHSSVIMYSESLLH